MVLFILTMPRNSHNYNYSNHELKETILKKQNSIQLILI